MTREDDSIDPSPARQPTPPLPRILESSKNSDTLTYKNYSSHQTFTVIKTSLKTTLFQVISSMQENTQIQIVYNYTIVRFKYKKPRKVCFPY